MNNNASKNVTLSIIGVALLVVAVVGVSFAFFSYVGGKTDNTVQTGTIVFNSTAEGMVLTNEFPQATYSDEDTLVVKVSGKTTYEKGIDYQVRVNEVQNASITEGENEVTIIPRIKVTGTPVTGVTVNVANNTSDGDDNANTALYSKTTTALAPSIIATGNIAAGTGLTTETPILTIQAYYSKDDYHISDTSTAEELKTLGMLADGWNGEVIKTATWNALNERGNAYSFKVQVIAVEGESGRLPQ